MSNRTGRIERLLLALLFGCICLDANAASALRLSTTVERVEQLGAASFLYCSLRGGERLTVLAPGQVGFSSGARVDVALPLAHLHVFATSDGEPALTAS